MELHIYLKRALADLTVPSSCQHNFVWGEVLLTKDISCLLNAVLLLFCNIWYVFWNFILLCLKLLITIHYSNNTPKQRETKNLY